MYLLIYLKKKKFTEAFSVLWMKLTSERATAKVKMESKTITAPYCMVKMP
jgi:hypothetical protein